MQGTRAAGEVMAAIDRLDRDPRVDVIVVARGGGAVEDLLPFSDEALVRAVAKCRTPVVSAIGHEPDQPLLDLVADVWASTPTDAAKLVVPDVAEELRIVAVGRDRLRGAITTYLDREATLLATLRSRPALADPASLLATRADEVDALRERALRTTRHRLDRATDEIAHHRSRSRALSPLATLQRGYAVLQGADGHVLTSVADVAAGVAVSVRVADGRIHADVTNTEELDG
jgi:exodeoxyribonuclease VII large subunit